MTEEKITAMIKLLDNGNYHVKSMVDHMRKILLELLKEELHRIEGEKK